ncbi:hypothetical protein KC335_g3221 [Hortaea werneckii]|nr:hypothetical protein KC335_g3221 [Hortaea werneckii]
MGAFLDVFKALFIPAAVAATLYALFTYLLLPFYRNHYARYRQYLPLSVNSSSNTRGLRTRFTDWLVNAMIPNSMRWGRDGDVVRYTSAADPDGTGARRGRDSFDSEVYVFGEEEGESCHKILRFSIIDTNTLISPLPHDWLSVATMYDEEAGIEVYTRPCGGDTGYREYRAPRSSPLYTGEKNERFIEAVNDERFEVVVKLDPAFDFKKYTQVRAYLDIDGGTIGCFDTLVKPEQRAEISTLLASSMSCEDGEWECVGFSFQELEGSEDTHLTVEEEEEEVLNRGRIQVTLQLGRKKWIKGKLNCSHNYALPGKTSSKVVNKGRSHRVITMPIDFQEEEKDNRDHIWMPAVGDAGKEIMFTFFYASRMILELNNIIPTPATVSKERTENKQTKRNQGTESRDETTAPLIVPEGSKFPKKPKEIISLDSDEEDPPPSKKIKIEVIEGASNTGAANPAQEIFMAKSSKGRERARIESQLEEIRLQREENRLRRQIMELED